MVRFWDTAAVFPLFVPERSSGVALELVTGDPAILVWWATRVECISALARLQREGVVALEIDAARLTLEAFASSWQEVLPTDSIRRRAETLLWRHTLRAADALQLAAALAAQEQFPTALDFVTLDKRLAMAARAEGFRVLPDETPERRS